MPPIIGVTGYSGMMGQELLKYPDVIPLPCDIRNVDEVDKVVKNIKFDLIVHLASISDVDVCENKDNFQLVRDTNVRGTKNVLDVAEKYKCGVLFLSTAQVFDGRWGNYKENSKPNPINMYGMTKLGGESFRSLYDNLKIVRTSYLFDYQRMFHKIYSVRAGNCLYTPTFMYRTFMYLPHFVESLYHYLLNWDSMPTMLHISGTRSVSWYDFIVNLAKACNVDTSRICPTWEDDKNYTPRPFKATLNVDLSKKLGFRQHDYVEGIRAMRELV